MRELVKQSIAVIESGQARNGAYVASPSFATYHYCWFRDGTFIAHAMDLWQRHESAERFYNWAANVITARTDAVERCVVAVARGKTPDPADLLDTRYTLDGEQGQEEWTDFQLDGFGTLLWGMERHTRLTGRATLPSSWATAADLLIRYLAVLWRLPNYDCWEEFPDHLAVSTLAAIHAGLQAISDVLDTGSPSSLRAKQTAEDIKDFTLARGVFEEHLIKHIGESADQQARKVALGVDASLLWASTPFSSYGLLRPDEPLMKNTVARIEADLIGDTGGVHRYREDTYYGGGEWILLTALLGQYYVQSGKREKALNCLSFVESQADQRGYLPEQSAAAPLYPEYVAQWVERWGSVARPLLWSHAEYLSLYALLHGKSIEKL